uniref:Uncharacterized protein n=1 Tax=Cacopsylla melanoneura TaxID=428564 RepID=A0A8D8VK51_9HEMI
MIVSCMLTLMRDPRGYPQAAPSPGCYKQHSLCNTVPPPPYTLPYHSMQTCLPPLVPLPLPLTNGRRTICGERVCDESACDTHALWMIWISVKWAPSQGDRVLTFCPIRRN